MLKQNTNHNERGYVLSLTPYREHDAMVFFIGELTGLRRLVLPGYYKAKSKQGSLGLEYSIVNYRFNPSKNHLSRITGGELINAFIQSRTSLEWLLMVSVIAELVIRNYEEENAKWYYDLIERHVHSKSSTIDVIQTIKDIIVFNGHEPELTGCVSCGSTKINAFSIEHGGYVCHNHSVKKQSKTILVALNAIFQGRNIQNHVTEDEQKEILDILIGYLEYHNDVRVNSWKIYQQIGKI